MIAIDTETTGLDVRHGARPYFVTICHGPTQVDYWEWPVNPLDRQPKIPKADLVEIERDIMVSPTLILQNAKFDVAALDTIIPGLGEKWPWDRTHDLLTSGHLLASNQKHDLTSMAATYLGRDIQPFEDALEDCVKKCRRKVQQAKLKVKRGKDKGDLADWRIAQDGLEEMPSVKKGSKKDDDTSSWKADAWLPRAYAEYDNTMEATERHRFRTVLREYGNADSASTLSIWLRHEKELKARGLTKIYEAKRKLNRIAYLMESNGVTLSRPRLEEIKSRYEAESESAGRVCINLASRLGYDLELPKGASPNASLRKFCFEVLNLPPMRSKKAKTDQPSLDKAAIEHYLATLPVGGRALAFIKTLSGKRSRDTAISFLKGYRRFWRPLEIYNDKGEQLWYRLHPNLNPTGTDTLRWSSRNPNEQNISGKEEFNLRYAFGPEPGWEWYSFDAKNLELRIPAFEAPEPDLIDVFLHPERPPYFGSYHLVVFDALHPDKFKEHGKKVKDIYESTWYKWIKNGNFALIYGGQEATVDAAYHVSGGFAKIRHRFPKVAELNDRQISMANRQGYVETIPDRAVDSDRGYPLMVSRTTWNRKVSPTLPFNYHIQGTACWWIGQAQVRCQELLDRWHAGTGFGGYMCLQVHDQLVFSFPKHGDVLKDVRAEAEALKKGERLPLFRTSNLWRVRQIQRLMEKGGDGIGVPTPVSCKYHPDNLSEGTDI